MILPLLFEVNHWNLVNLWLAMVFSLQPDNRKFIEISLSLWFIVLWHPSPGILKDLSVSHSFHSRLLFRNLLLPAVTTKRFFQFQAKSLSIRIKKIGRHVTSIGNIFLPTSRSSSSSVLFLVHIPHSAAMALSFMFHFCGISFKIKLKYDPLLHFLFFFCVPCSLCDGGNCV